MITLLSSPLTWLLLSVAGLLSMRRTTWLRALLYGVLGVSVLAMTPAAGNAALRVAERGAGLASTRACGVQDRHAPVLLLSAGLRHAPGSAQDVAALGDENWRRVQTALSAWNPAHGDELLVAGGGPFPVREAEVLRTLLLRLGAPARGMRLEDRSTTTWESARALHAMRVPAVRVATSREHLPRALLALHAAGVPACALDAPSDVQGPGGVGYFLPQTAGLRKTERATYELLGLAMYRIRAARQR